MYCTKVCILLPPRGLIPSREAHTGSLAQPNDELHCLPIPAFNLNSGGTSIHSFSPTHYSQTANISSQSVLPITIINMSSNSIPFQSMSKWLLDSEDYCAHVNLHDQLHSQHPQLLPLSWLQSMQSQSIFNKSYAIGDEVLFEGSPELYIFLGEKWIHQHNNEGQDGYFTEFRAPREPSYPPWSIQLRLHHQIQQDRIIPPSHFLSWD